MSAREKRRETTAGLFVLIGLLLLGVLIIEFGRFGDRLSNHYPLYLEFSNTAGIIKGSDVRLRGAKIGSVVTKPELITTHTNGSVVRIEIRVRDDIQIPNESTVKIGSSGIMGDSFIQIVPPEKESGIYYKPGDTIMGGGAGGFDSIRTDAETIAREASKRLMDAEETLNKMDNALEEIKKVAANLNITIHKINTEFLTPENLGSFSHAMANFETASNNLNTASNELQPIMIEAKRTLASIHKAADSADTLIASTQQEIKHLEPALRDIPKAVQSITRAADTASDAMASFKNEDSALGTLTADTETGTNTKQFMRNLKRYGILRYRDDSSPEQYDPRNHFRGSRR
jgi:phospholipid/cholesterol/gamma-HCH transport system substrate-binding protein